MSASVVKDWTIFYRFPTEDTPDYQIDMHTVGFNNKNLPELGLVLNISQSEARDFLTYMAECQMDGIASFSKEQTLTGILNDAPVSVIPVSLTNELKVSFFILPDSNGKLPTDPECEFPFNKQFEFLENIKRSYQKEAISS